MKKILVIDDDADILEAVQIALESEGFTVLTDPTGNSVNRLASNNMPDLILLDVLLSGEDGRHIAKTLKTQAHTQNIPIIMMSAHPSLEKPQTEYIVDDILPKPFDIDMLLHKVKKYA